METRATLCCDNYERDKISRARRETIQTISHLINCPPIIRRRSNDSPFSNGQGGGGGEGGHVDRLS